MNVLTDSSALTTTELTAPLAQGPDGRTPDRGPRSRGSGSGQEAHDTVCWPIPTKPAAVSAVRARVAAQLTRWGLEALSYSTELIASELAANAIRHGCAPIHLRLIRDDSLICEVSDGSGSGPRPRRADGTDEGGRGLALVAELADRWGHRRTAEGKVVWTEQFLAG